jgi:hypothetical protein
LVYIFFVERINFEQPGPQRAFALQLIPTRFKLTPDEVETLITAGKEALRKNPTFQKFVDSTEGRVASLQVELLLCLRNEMTKQHSDVAKAAHPMKPAANGSITHRDRRAMRRPSA